MQMKSLHYGIFASITLSLLLFSTFSIAITDNIGLNVMTTVENRTCQSEISNRGWLTLALLEWDILPVMLVRKIIIQRKDLYCDSKDCPPLAQHQASCI